MDESHNAIYVMVHPTGGILEPGIFAKVSGIRAGGTHGRHPRLPIYFAVLLLNSASFMGL
jgi:hypothetical protein